MAYVVDIETVSADLAGIIDEVNATQHPVVLRRGGHPVAVVIDPHAFERLLAADREAAWQAITAMDERARADDADDLELLIAEEIEAVRRERQTGRQRTA